MIEETASYPGDAVTRETDELEDERLRLAVQPRPLVWDRASWLKGAQYAIAWIINRRGAELSPLDAVEAFPDAWPKDQRSPPREDPVARALTDLPPSTSRPEQT